MKYVYIGRMLSERKGQPCKLLNTWRRNAPHNVLIEFEGGFKVVCPMRCLRKRKDGSRYRSTARSKPI